MATWTKDPVAEKNLTTLGAKFEYREAVEISKLKVEESKKNNARFNNPIDEEKVQQYAAAMADNVPFLALVITPNGFILAGNNRLAAAIQNNDKTVAAYVVLNGTPQMYDQFTRTDNRRHGLSLTEDETIQQCIHLHEKFKTPLTTLNRDFFGPVNRTYAKMTTAWEAHQAAKQLNSEGIDASRLNTSVLAALHTLAPTQDGGLRNIKILKAVATAAIKLYLKVEEIIEVLRKVKDCSTEKEALAKVDECAAEFSKRRTHPEAAARTTMLSNLTRMENYLLTGNGGHKFENLKQAQITDPTQTKTVSAQIAKIINLLRQLKKGSK